MTSTSGFIPVKCSFKGAFSLREKNIILNVHDALVHQRPLSNVREIVNMCSNMTGVGEATIYRFLKERKGGTVSSPKKSGGSKPLEIEEIHKNMIRSSVHSFFLTKNFQHWTKSKH
jgi:hypothetical protein